MLCCAYRNPISIFISSWDYYEYEKVLEMTIEEFAYAVDEGILDASMYQLVTSNFKIFLSIIYIYFFLNS